MQQNLFLSTLTSHYNYKSFDLKQKSKINEISIFANNQQKIPFRYRTEETIITKVTQQIHHDPPRDLRSRTIDSLSTSISKLWKLSTRSSTSSSQQQTRQNTPTAKWSLSISHDLILTVYRRKPERKAKIHSHVDLNDFLAIK